MCTSVAVSNNQVSQIIKVFCMIWVSHLTRFSCNSIKRLVYQIDANCVVEQPPYILKDVAFTVLQLYPSLTSLSVCLSVCMSICLSVCQSSCPHSVDSEISEYQTIQNKMCLVYQCREITNTICKIYHHRDVISLKELLNELPPLRDLSPFEMREK